MEEPPIIIGIDEAGRGPIFGPMVVGASCNLRGWSHPEVRDSKLIKAESERQRLDAEIRANAMWGVATISVDAINRFGTRKTLMIAGQKIAREMIAKVRIHYPDRRILVIFDGTDHPDRIEGTVEYKSIEKADALYFEVSCGSILAKVHHDNLIHQIVSSDAKYQCYDLDQCKGYGVPKHRKALEQFGRTDQHRTEATNTLLGLNNGKAPRKTPVKQPVG